jgi:predicted regulator of Ras-like GTPase activity (Roadblock/LC7/MglB family)
VAFAPPPPATAAPASGEAPMTFGDIFGQPAKKDWTPQEIVEKAATLRGVAGALITTVDGLPVAFHLPSNLSGNAMAAFIPQMYTRITQYTRDLKLGDAKHLTIFVENTPLQIFKSGSVYFTALGKTNENLPKPQLTAIAAALGRPIQS